jgi:gluconokinase
MILVLMGVSGSGKTTVGQLLAATLGWPFYDADAFHPPTNIEKMKNGIPLTEEDRIPWLEAMHAEMDCLIAGRQSAVMTCSALTALDRSRLVKDDRDIRLIYLHGSFELIRQRLEARKGHFFRPELLASQFATLQEPRDLVTISIDQSPSMIVESIINALGIELESEDTDL